MPDPWCTWYIGEYTQSIGLELVAGTKPHSIHTYCHGSYPSRHRLPSWPLSRNVFGCGSASQSEPAHLKCQRQSEVTDKALKGIEYIQDRHIASSFLIPEFLILTRPGYPGFFVRYPDPASGIRVQISFSRLRNISSYRTISKTLPYFICLSTLICSRIHRTGTLHKYRPVRIQIENTDKFRFFDFNLGTCWSYHVDALALSIEGIEGRGHTESSRPSVSWDPSSQSAAPSWTTTQSIQWYKGSSQWSRRRRQRFTFHYRLRLRHESRKRCHSHYPSHPRPLRYAAVEERQSLDVRIVKSKEMDSMLHNRVRRLAIRHLVLLRPLKEAAVAQTDIWNRSSALVPSDLPSYLVIIGRAKESSQRPNLSQVRPDPTTNHGCLMMAWPGREAKESIRASLVPA